MDTKELSSTVAELGYELSHFGLLAAEVDGVLTAEDRDAVADTLPASNSVEGLDYEVVPEAIPEAIPAKETTETIRAMLLSRVQATLVSRLAFTGEAAAHANHCTLATAGGPDRKEAIELFHSYFRCLPWYIDHVAGTWLCFGCRGAMTRRHVQKKFTSPRKPMSLRGCLL